MYSEVNSVLSSREGADSHLRVEEEPTRKCECKAE